MQIGPCKKRGGREKAAASGSTVHKRPPISGKSGRKRGIKCCMKTRVHLGVTISMETTATTKAATQTPTVERAIGEWQWLALDVYVGHN